MSEFTLLTVQNPAPRALSNVQITSTFETLFLRYATPVDADWAGILVWMSKSPGFATDETTLVYRGNAKPAIIDVEPGTTYYLKVAAYDDFTETPALLNVSSELTHSTAILELPDIPIIDETKIADDSISTPKIQANAVTAAEIAALTITAGEIAANTITAAKIAANTITATEIAAATITTTQIAANTIQAANIASATITGGKLVAGTITTTQIAAATIVAGDIASRTITADRITLGTLSLDEMIKMTQGEQLVNTALSSTATADFDIDQGYGAYEVFIEDLVPATDDTFVWVRVSTDGGSNFLTTTTYSWRCLNHNEFGLGTRQLNSATAIALNGSTVNEGVGTATGEGWNCKFQIYGMASGGPCFGIIGTGVQDAAGNTSQTSLFGGNQSSGSQITDIRILMSSGNMSSGRIRLFGIGGP